MLDKIRKLKIPYSNGFSLIEGMIASLILAGIALGGATVIKNLNSNQKTLEVKYELLSITNHINQLLLDKDVTGATFKGLSASRVPAANESPLSIDCILDKNKNPIYFKGQKVGNIFIEDFKLIKSAADVDNVLNVTLTPIMRKYNNDVVVNSKTCLQCKPNPPFVNNSCN